VLLLMLAAYGVASMAAPSLVRHLGRRAFLLLALVPAAAFVDTARRGADIRDGAVHEWAHAWIPDLGVDLVLRLDTLSWVLALLVTGVGALVLAYCGSYFRTGDAGLGRFAGVLTAFAGAMHGLVLADDVIVLFVFWEATTIFSYLLIGHSSTRAVSRRAALQALVVTTMGGLAMLVGLIMLGSAAGTYRLSLILADPPRGDMVTVAVLLVLVGAVSKSALVPFHFWLPAAMAAPTPVSAYLHAAAMVKAGIYLIARLAPGFADSPGWRGSLLTLGLLTMLVGGYRALREHDLKLVLAYGTVSQLGFLTIVVGFGERDTALAGLAMVIAHALFKATLFLTVGVIDHSAGTRDLRQLSGLGRQSPILLVTASLAAASMAGLPPFAGFVAKEAILGSLLDAGSVAGTVAVVGVTLGSCLTVAYSARFLWGAFARKPGVPDVVARHERPAILAPGGLLAVAGLVVGLGASLEDPWLAPYADRLPGGKPYHLALWHGLEPALGLSAITVVVGLLLFAARAAVTRFQSAVETPMDANAAYRHAVLAVDRLAVGLTRRTQVGSLPVYLGVILTVLVAAVVYAFSLGVTWPTSVRWWDTPAQGLLAVLIVVAAISATRATKRFGAVVVVGAAGYTVALIFALHGAPDLALTQILIETITLVAFVLVLRRLPIRIGELSGSSHRRLRALIAVGVGVVMTAAAAVAMAARSADPISRLWAEPAYTYGGGENIVNVALVDIRAWDTLGEISVLVVAATGVASLIFIRKRTGAAPRLASEDAPGLRFQPVSEPLDVHAADPRARDADPDNDDEPSSSTSWLMAGRTLAPENRSILLEVVVRLGFHAGIMVSLYLLFSGHNIPGGGFSGGLVAGLALAARYLAGGRYELGEAAPVDAGWVLGGGLALACTTGVLGLALGGDVLQTEIFHFWLPVFGDVKLVTALFFDIGVYLVVVGLMLDVLRSLGAEIDRQGVEEDAA
jgi:multicomponent Na+:H+ antiporter subunit A